MGPSERKESLSRAEDLTRALFKKGGGVQNNISVRNISCFPEMKSGSEGGGLDLAPPSGDAELLSNTLDLTPGALRTQVRVEGKG